MKKIYFENSRGLRLSGILAKPRDKDKCPLVILCHGLWSNKYSNSIVDISKILLKNKIATLRFDFTGHGNSEGDIERITISQGVDDLNSALNYIKTLNWIDNSRVGLQGSSFSGIVVLAVASKNPWIKLLSLKSPVVDYIKIGSSQTDIKEWKKKGFAFFDSLNKSISRLYYDFYEDAKKYHGYNYAKKIKIPCLVVHGDKDTTVPITQSKELVKILKNSRLETIRGADHIYKGEFFEKMVRLLSVWFVENL